ncbi:MAG: bifunctional adenosylcobinamide kinase/adenosylcobinamide-phosphate guanylyltransferase [Eubacteriales bacterium]|nr:bifunctional adenosylcobinamide kinase/adenosylcobinamide-phosphate guanylyltransferase [Eubacteriales bacterium]MDD4541299.1 bifunctional adenosylcobinamide kinase/adenosylcobinamide-phosphate guanylyltransferase [Eubacteriales bacterium]
MVERTVVVFGGQYQGKHEYIRDNYPDADKIITVDYKLLKDIQSLYLSENTPDELSDIFDFPVEQTGESILFFDSTQWPHDGLLENALLDPKFWDCLVNSLSNAEKYLILLFCIDEIACGTIPAERTARRLREVHGSWLQWVSAKSDEVIRIVAGLIQRLK